MPGETVLDRFRMEDEVALVTGAASGIGRGISEALTEAGADLAVADVDEEGLAETVATVEGRGVAVHPITADVSEPSETEQMVTETVERFGGLDAAFANAGVASLGSALANYDLDTASILAHRGSEMAGLGAYTASKGGVVSLTRQLDAELGTEGIRVNAIAPVWVHNDIGGGTFHKDAEEMAEFHEEMAERTAVVGSGNWRTSRDSLSSSQAKPPHTAPGELTSSTAVGPPSDLRRSRRSSPDGRPTPRVLISRYWVYDCSWSGTPSPPRPSPPANRSAPSWPVSRARVPWASSIASPWSRVDPNPSYTARRSVRTVV